MTTPNDDQDEANTTWLLLLSPEQISRYDRVTICDWLIARNEERSARLRSACQTLRELSKTRERAYARIAAALTTEPTA